MERGDSWSPLSRFCKYKKNLIKQGIDVELVLFLEEGGEEPLQSNISTIGIV